MDVPELVANGRRYVTDEEKAEVLMDTFFPIPPLPKGRDPSRAARSRVEHNTKWPPLTKNEVERAIFKSSPDKAPGPDEISFRVWRELWPVVGDTSYGCTIPHSNCSIRHASGRQQGSLHFGSPERPIIPYRKHSVRSHSSRQLVKDSRQQLLPGCPLSRRRITFFRVTTSEQSRVGLPSRH